MKQSKEVKGTVLCEKFNEKFADLVLNSDNLISVFCSTYKYERTFFLSDYMKLFKCSKVVIDRYYDLSNSDFKNKIIFYRFNVVDGSNTYFYSISIYLNCEIFIHIEDNNGKIVDSYTLRFSEDSFNCFINSIRTDEENASEPEQEEQDNPEQPVEDAEEPAEYEEDCFSIECSERTNGKVELTLGTGKNAVTKYYSSYDEMYEDNPEYRELFFEVLSVNARLSPLERTVFEAIEDCFKRYNEYAELVKVAEYNGESAEEIVRYGHLANEQIFNSDYLKELISKAGLDETYQSWLKERREREQNESLEV